MHMADALISPAVGGVMTAAAAGLTVYAVKKLGQEPDAEQKIPLMGVLGAFVFAGQMINFTIPATGSSGHIGGGILLAALLGAPAAFLTLAVVLLIQCLLFADGGLLALGCNIFNIGFWPCLIVYPLLFSAIMRRGLNRRRIFAASVISAILGLQLGAFSVVVETLASGVTELPFAAFLALMQPIHLAIGAVEGLLTGAVLCFVYQMQPQLLADHPDSRPAAPRRTRQTLVLLLAAALLLAGGLSLYASGLPDGLEWAIANVSGGAELQAEGALHQGSAAAQQATALLPDYGFRDGTGGSAAGIIGSALTLLLAAVLGWAVSRGRRRKAAGRG